MRCQKCKKREVIVHVTHVFTRSGKTKKYNLCQECYNKSSLNKRAKSAGWTSYNPVEAFGLQNDAGS